MNAATWTAIASAAAAVAAIASWATVWQARRERFVAQTPDLHIHAMYRSLDRTIRVTLVNNGGIACNVQFWVCDGFRVVGGAAKPTATFLPGERRTYDTDIEATDDDVSTKAVVFAESLDHRRAFARPEGHRVTVARVKGWRKRRFVVDDFIEETFPGAWTQARVRGRFWLSETED